MFGRINRKLFCIVFHTDSMDPNMNAARTFDAVGVAIE